MAGWTDGLAVGRPVVAVAGGARRTTHHQRQQSGRRLVDARPTGPTLGSRVTSVTPRPALASIRHGVNAGGLGDKDDRPDSLGEEKLKNYPELRALFFDASVLLLTGWVGVAFPKKMDSYW